MATILSLDDVPEMLELLSLILERMGYRHLTTTSGTKALTLLHTRSIDLFTQDFLRPEMDGWEFLQLLKSDETLRDIPVVGISSTLCHRNKELERSMGLDLDRDLAATLSKPFSPLELLDIVAVVLMQRNVPLPSKHQLFIQSNHRRHLGSWFTA